MTLQERVTETQARASRLYLRRQEIETQRQALSQQGQAVDLALVRTDGELELLAQLIAAEVPSGQ